MPDDLKKVLTARGLAPRRDPAVSPDEAELQKMMRPTPLWPETDPVRAWFLQRPFTPGPPPIIGGTPTIEKMVRQAFLEFPALNGQVSKVIVGPDVGMADLLTKSKFGLDEYDLTNIYGTQDKNTREISLNPRLREDAIDVFAPANKKFDVDNIIIHELAHAMGWGEHNADRAADLYAGRKAKDIELPSGKKK